MAHGEERFMAILALLAIILIASLGPLAAEPRSVLSNYAYWAFRISAECLLFFAVRSAIEKYFVERFGFAAITALAIIISHVPFVLSVTAIDIVLGYPELGINGGAEGSQSRLGAIMLEMLYLADNHIAVCLLMSMPRWILNSLEGGNPEAEPGTATLLDALDPPLDGTVIWIEAQEHYVRIRTSRDSRMVLARFSDVIRELSATKGLQVHRSHWVLESAIVRKLKSGQNLSLELSTGDIVPVSRSFRHKVNDVMDV